MLPVILLLALAPAAALALFFYAKDRYEKEPARFLLRAFLGGALITLYAIAAEWVLGGYIASIPFRILRVALTAFVLAGLVEEGLKYLRFRSLVYKNANFNEPFDGIVYGVMISLGFAAVENIGFVFRAYAVMGAGGMALTGITRAVLAVPSHACFGAIMGHYFSRAKFAGDKTLGPRQLRRALWVPAALHGAFDFLLFMGSVAAFMVFIYLVVQSWMFAMRAVREASDGSPFRKRENDA